MKPLPDFSFHTPRKLDEALHLMADLEDVKPIAGGTDLIPSIREGVASPSNLVDLNRIQELNYIEPGEAYLHIGATITHSQLLKESATSMFGALVDSVSWIGSPQIRNLGTLAGNILNASPAADSAPPLLVHNAKVKIESISETRTIPVNELFVGPKINCLEEDELLTEIKLPLPPADASSGFERIGRRKAFTLSVVSAAVYLQVEDDICKDARIAFGSVDTTPVRIKQTEELLRENKLSDEMVSKACASVKEYVKPITDIRGTAEYRRDMCEVLMKRALIKAWERVGE